MMNSELASDGDRIENQMSHESTEFYLSTDQYQIIQHYLPPRFTLVQQTRPTKRTITSMHRLEDLEHNTSRISASEEVEGRQKRPRTKRLNRYPEEDNPKKRHQSQDTFSDCLNILNLLKKHKNGYPFLSPVDPKLDNAEDYFDVVKEPMDFSTIEKKLKGSQYATTSQFHADVCKVWDNSYKYNDRTSALFKLTSQMDKYYRNQLNKVTNFKKNKKLEPKKNDFINPNDALQEMNIEMNNSGGNSSNDLISR